MIKKKIKDKKEFKEPLSKEEFTNWIQMKNKSTISKFYNEAKIIDSEPLIQNLKYA